MLAFTAEVISEAEITSTGSPIPESAHLDAFQSGMVKRSSRLRTSLLS